VLVVVRADDQIDDQANNVWRTYSDLDGEISVLLISLQMLASVSSHGCSGWPIDVSTNGNEGAGSCGGEQWHALIDQPCWLDVRAHKQPTWKRIGAALYLTRAR
jgi:hypothetical protein